MKNLLRERTSAIAARKAAAAAKLFDVNRDAWYWLCNSVNELEARCAAAGLLCANYNISCPNPAVTLDVEKCGKRFCCNKCASEYWAEVDGEAAVRAQDLRDY